MSLLTAAFAVLAIAVALGTVLFVLHLHSDPGGSARWKLAALHGLLGVGGLVGLTLALSHPPLRPDQGTAGFDKISVLLLAAAALLGGGIFAVRFAGGSRAGTLIGIHATIAISGFVILAAYMLV